MGAMLTRVSRRTVALAVQFAGIVTLAMVSLLGLNSDDSTWLPIGAFIFVVGCLLEAQFYARSHAELVEVADADLPEIYRFE